MSSRFLTLTSISPASSRGSSSFCNSKLSNHIAPQPPRQTSTAMFPAGTVVSAVAQTGHFMCRTGSLVSFIAVANHIDDDRAGQDQTVVLLLPDIDAVSIGQLEPLLGNG